MDPQTIQPQSALHKFSVPFAIIIAGVFIALALYFSGSKASAPTQPLPDKVVTGDMRPVDDNDHILGNPNADLVIVEYSDTGCPFCKQFHKTMQTLMNEYGKGGKVAWVYRHFPIDQLHPNSRKEAEATECASELGGPEKFWAYTNTIYERAPQNGGFKAEQLKTIAKDIGLDVTAFNECLSSGRKAAVVEADYQDGVKAGARGTPYSLIIRKKDGSKVPISGAQPYASLKGTIELLLK